MKVSATATAAVRTNLSPHHLLGAAFLAHDCYPLERDYVWPANDEILFRHSAYAIGAIVLSASALEAAANEFYQDAADRHLPALGKAAPVAELIVQTWDTVERSSILRKYEWFLQLAGCAPMHRGDAEFRAAGDVVELRNALVHFKPEWSSDLKRNQKLEARLIGKFAHNRLSMPGQHFIPYRGLGHGSGVWAVRAIQRFVDGFYSVLSAPSRFESFADPIDGALRVDDAQSLDRSGGGGAPSGGKDQVEGARTAHTPRID
jgi:hypothetical protein